MNEISYVVERNPSITVNINRTYYRIQTIGDVHLEKHFLKSYRQYKYTPSNQSFHGKTECLKNYLKNMKRL